MNISSSNRHLNLEDIAKKAGVSRSTVSRVINNEPHVNVKTRERVLDVIAHEGFRPNPAARMLVTQRTRVIGIVIPGTLNIVFEDPYYFPTLLQGVAEITQQQDYGMLLWLGQAGEDEERFYNRIVQNRLMDGLIVASATVDDPLITRLVEMGTQFVMVERPARHHESISYVSVDNVKTAQIAVEHLINQGRRRIATITGALNNVDGLDRLEGYKLALDEAGIALDSNLVAEGRFTRRSGYLAVKKLLKYAPDAIFAASDLMALGALDALKEANLRVPEDVAIVGFDDLPSGLHSSPPLTTMRHPIQQKGAMATSMLLDIIEGNITSPRQILLPTQLVIRKSCGIVDL
jgi:DNA-binding LacI/PurR family transcriptional regulator